MFIVKCVECIYFYFVYMHIRSRSSCMEPAMLHRHASTVSQNRKVSLERTPF